MPNLRHGMPPPRRRRRRRLDRKKLLRFCALVLAAAALVYFGLPALVNAGRLRPQLVHRLAEITGRQVECGTLEYSVRHRALVGGDFVIAEDANFGNVPFLQSRTVYFEVPILSLIFSRQPGIRRVTFDNPTIIFKENAAGRWNYYSLLNAAARAGADFSPPAIEITGGRVGVESLRENSQYLRFQDFKLSIRAMLNHAPSPFTLSATVMRSGRLQVSGQAGPLYWEQGKPMLPVNALLHLKDFDLSQWTGSGNASSLGGRLSLDGAIESNGRRLDFNGQAKSSKLKLTAHGEGAGAPLDAVFTIEHDLDTHSGVLSRCDLGVQKGTASLVGKYDTQGALLLDLNLSVIAGPVTQLALFLPAVGAPLPPGSALEGGAMDAALKIQGPFENPNISGPVSVDDTRVGHFYLSQRMAPVEGLESEDLDDRAEILSWKSKIQSDEKGIGLQDLAVAIAGLGTMSGSGLIAPDGRLNFTMAGIRGLTGLKGTPIPFVVLGTSRNPVFEPPARKRD